MELRFEQGRGRERDSVVKQEDLASLVGSGVRVLDGGSESGVGVGRVQEVQRRTLASPSPPILRV